MKTDSDKRIDPDQLPLPREPYRGILAFRLLDWRIFLERDVEIESVGNLVSIYGGVLLYGQSGSGKSSLLNAGLVPQALRQGRTPERVRVRPEKGRELLVERIHLREEDGDSGPDEGGLPVWLPSRFSSAQNDEGSAVSCAQFLDVLRTTAGDPDFGLPLLIFDQFEELVTLFEENPKNKERVAEAQAARKVIEKLLVELLVRPPVPVKIIFAFRDDYLARLSPLFSHVPNLMDQRVWLELPRVDLVEQIVRGPFVPAEDGVRGLPGHFQPELSVELAGKFAAGIRARQPSGLINLSEIQTLCLALWKEPKWREELGRAADPAPVLQKILESVAEAALNKLLLWDRFRATAVLTNLVTEQGTRDVVSEGNLVRESERALPWFARRGIVQLLALLPEKTRLLRRSLSSGTTYYEITSEFLVPWIQKRQVELRRARFVWRFYLFVIVCGALIAVGGLYSLRLDRALYEAESARRQAERATVDALEEKHHADKAAKEARDALEQASKAKAETDAMRKRSDALVGLVSFVEKDLTAALQETHQDALAAEFQKRLAEYRKQYADAVPANGSVNDHLVEIREKADHLRDKGDLAGALQLYLLGYDIAGKESATDAALNLWMPRFLRDQGDVLMSQGNRSQAKERYQLALEVDRKAINANADDKEWLHDLSLSYEAMGDALKLEGDLSKALQSYRDSLAIAEKLAKADPGNTEWQDDLSDSYNEIGDVQSAQGDLQGALKSFGDGLAIRDKLATQDPGNANWQRNLSVGYDNVGDVRSALGDLAGALKSFGDGLAVRDKLAKQDPSNAKWQYDLSVSYVNIARALGAQGDLDGELKNDRASLAIREKLAKQDPGNAKWQHGLAVIYNNVAIVQRAQDDFAGALKTHRDSLAITEKLAKQDPSNADWQRDLSVGYCNVASVQSAQGDLAGALKSLRDSLAIAEKLAKQDPSNADWQGALGLAYWQTGAAWAQAQPKTKNEPRAMVEKGRDTLRELKKRTGLTAEQQRWLDSIETVLRDWK